MAARVHFFSGKGGVGKSTLAAALALRLARTNRRTLLIDVQGQGYALQLLGLLGCPYQNTPIPKRIHLWGSRIRPLESFQQYFSILLSLGNEESSFGLLTSKIREKIVRFLFENQIFKSFSETCPGLEPAVLLGKIHWEATRGQSPESQMPWEEIVVDAPSTGHFLMLFKSAFALTEVFSSGVVYQQAREIESFLKKDSQCKIYLVTTPQELPVTEVMELHQSLRALGFPSCQIVVNRSVLEHLEESSENFSLPDGLSSSQKILEAYLIEKELEKEERRCLEQLTPLSPQKIVRFPEYLNLDEEKIFEKISTEWPEHL